MDLNETFIFVKVVEHGSFARAASLLDMPKSTVSAKVSALERRLGVTLIRRTTRRLFVTDAGRDYFQTSVQALQQLAKAEEQVSERQSVPQGPLKITAPVELGGSILSEVIHHFQKQYPLVDLEISLTDRTVDLVPEGFDLALRAGELKDSTLIAKKLGSVYFAPFASPKYLKQFGTPKAPKDLKDYFCIQFKPLGSQGWKLSGPKGTQVVSLNKRLLINDLNLIKALAISGMGIALLPTYFCYSETQDQKLTRILSDWRSNISPVHFVYPAQDFIPRKLSAFLEIGAKIISGSLNNFNY